MQGGFVCIAIIVQNSQSDLDLQCPQVLHKSAPRHEGMKVFYWEIQLTTVE